MRESGKRSESAAKAHCKKQPHGIRNMSSATHKAIDKTYCETTKHIYDKRSPWETPLGRSMYHLSDKIAGNSSEAASRTHNKY